MGGAAESCKKKKEKERFANRLRKAPMVIWSTKDAISGGIVGFFERKTEQFVSKEWNESGIRLV